MKNQKLLFAIGLLLFQLPLFAGEEEKVDLAEQNRSLALQISENAQKFKARFEQYPKDPLAEDIFTYCDGLTSSMQTVLNLKEKHLEHSGLKPLLIARNARLRKLYTSASDVLDVLDLSPNNTLTATKKYFDHWHPVLGSCMQGPALAWWALRTALPRRRKLLQDAACGAAGVTTAVVLKNAVSGSGTTVHVHLPQAGAERVTIGSSSSSSRDSSSSINSDAAIKGAAILLIGGGAIAAGKYGWAWWNGSSSREVVTDLLAYGNEATITEHNFCEILKLGDRVDAVAQSVVANGERVGDLRGELLNPDTGAIPMLRAGVANIRQRVDDLRFELLDPERGRLATIEKSVGDSEGRLRANIYESRQLIDRLQEAVSGDEGLSVQVAAIAEQIRVAEEKREHDMIALQRQVKESKLLLDNAVKALPEAIQTSVNSAFGNLERSGKWISQEAFAAGQRSLLQELRAIEAGQYQQQVMSLAHMKMTAMGLAMQMQAAEGKPLTFDMDEATALLMREAFSRSLPTSVPPAFCADSLLDDDEEAGRGYGTVVRRFPGVLGFPWMYGLDFPAITGGADPTKK